MGQNTTPITATRFFRQPTEPPAAADGATWVTDSDGSGGDTSSRYTYNAAADRWELDSAVGPSKPTLGTPVAGALWRDTTTGLGKQYDGVDFVSLTPSQTGNSGELIGEVAKTVGVDYTVPVVNTYNFSLGGGISKVTVVNPSSNILHMQPDSVVISNPNRSDSNNFGSTVIEDGQSETYDLGSVWGYAPTTVTVEIDGTSNPNSKTIGIEMDLSTGGGTVSHDHPI